MAVVLGVGGFLWSKQGNQREEPTKRNEKPITAVAASPAPPPAPAAVAVSTAPTRAQPRPEPAALGIVPAAIEKSLVVLPLENLSPDPADAYFAEGMHEDLITTLSRLEDVTVIGRASALRSKGSQLAVQQFAERLGVAHVLRGSVRRERDHVMLKLELRRADNDGLVWAKHYDTAPQDMHAVQTHIAQGLTTALGARAPYPHFSFSRFFTRDGEAFDLLLKARLAKGAAPDVDRSETSIRLAEAALARDPEFGAAALLLSACYVAAYRAERDQATSPRFKSPAKRWAETAARLIPGGGADSALAFYHIYIEQDTSRSLPLAQNAARALPNFADQRYTLAVASFRAGRLLDAANEHRRSVVLDPRNFGKRQMELHALARLRRNQPWEQATHDYRTMIGSDQPAEVNAEQRFALTGEFPTETARAKMNYLTRMDWLWRERKFRELAALAEAELPKLKFMGEISALKMRWGDALSRLDRQKEAAVLSTEALSLARDIATRPLVDPTANDTRVGQALARSGLGDDAIAFARRGVEAIAAERHQSERWDREIKLAEIDAQLGRAPECVAVLATLLQAPTGLTVPMLRTDPIWDNVREDAGFKALLADPKNSAPL